MPPRPTLEINPHAAPTHKKSWHRKKKPCRIQNPRHPIVCSSAFIHRSSSPTRLSFLTPILLAGAAAFLVPLIIHLLNRRRIIQVQWGAMHLLHEVLKQKKRRMQIEQWLLLLTRIAIPIVLALCLARPVLTALSQLPGFSKSSLIVLLDDTFSMRATTPDGSPAADQARADLARILSALPRGSDAQIIRMGSQPRSLNPSASTALDLLSTDLSATPIPTQGPIALQNSLQSALAAAEKAGQPAREILVLSDFQRSDWAPLLTGASIPALDAIKNSTSDASRPTLTLFPLSTQISENLSIAAAEPSAQLIAVGQPVALRVRIQNHGQRPWQDIPIHLEADGTRLRTTRLSIPPDGEASLYFTHAFDAVGDHALTVRLEGDTFTDDNAFHTVIQVRDQLPVVLIDAAPSSTAMSGALDFLALALAPHLGSATPDLRDLIVTRTLDARRLKASDLTGARVAILGGLQRPTANLMQLLLDFTESGGGLLILPAENADPIQWQRELGQNAARFPALISGQAHIENSDFPARLQTTRFTHPALLYFNDPRAGRLADGEIQHWWKLEPQGDDARTLASLDRGPALLIERPLGRGLIIQSAIPLKPGWSNLPLQPWFVPLAQRLIAWLATQDTESSSHLIGAAPTLSLPESLSDQTFALTHPIAQSPSLQAKGTTLTLPPLEQPGLFQLTATSAAPNPANTRQIAVNLDPAESNLTPLTTAELDDLATRINAQVATDLDSYQRLDRTRRFGIEVWQPLLLALLALLFFEVILQQYLTSGKRR